MAASCAFGVYDDILFDEHLPPRIVRFRAELQSRGDLRNRDFLPDVYRDRMDGP